MNPTPERPKVRASVVPLTGMQLLCCAAVAGLGIKFTSGLFQHADTTTQAAVTAFEVAATAQAAAEAALARFTEISVVVQRNDTLDAIFRRLEFSLVDLASIRALDGARTSLDKLVPGDKLTLATRDGQLVGLQRPISLNQTFKVERDATEGFVASVEEVPLTRHVHTGGGAIESSLWAAVAVAGLRASSFAELERIFQWDVDFHGVQTGDSFRLVYEQLERDGEIVADGNILAAEFVHQGKTIRAVRYERADGKADYYTPEGSSLRKEYLKAPVQASRISSGFNPRRRHPVLNTIRAHRGVDYAAPRGTPVIAVSAGRVQFRGVKGGFGNVVEIAHAGKVVTRYGHLSAFAKGLSVGSRVEQGQEIGRVGSTGLATGPHLHFEFMRGGKHVDPQKEMRRGEPGQPVPASERARFDAQAAPLLAQLGTVPLPAGLALVAR